MTVAKNNLEGTRKETDSLGQVNVPSDKLWGAQTQRSLEHFSIGKDLIPREMISAYATLKKAAANANHAGGRLNEEINSWSFTGDSRASASLLRERTTKRRNSYG
jgi:fumarate hydratase class II